MQSFWYKKVVSPMILVLVFVVSSNVYAVENKLLGGPDPKAHDQQINLSSSGHFQHTLLEMLWIALDKELSNSQSYEAVKKVVAQFNTLAIDQNIQATIITLNSSTDNNTVNARALYANTRPIVEIHDRDADPLEFKMPLTADTSLGDDLIAKRIESAGHLANMDALHQIEGAVHINGTVVYKQFQGFAVTISRSLPDVWNVGKSVFNNALGQEMYLNYRNSTNFVDASVTESFLAEPVPYTIMSTIGG